MKIPKDSLSHKNKKEIERNWIKLKQYFYKNIPLMMRDVMMRLIDCARITKTPITQKIQTTNFKFLKFFVECHKSNFP